MVAIFENLILAILCLFCIGVILLLLYILACFIVQAIKTIKKEVQDHDRTE